MKNNWQKKLTISLACATFLTTLTATVPTYANYTLSSEVKTVTPALKNAAEIGVRTFENKAMQNLENKDAIAKPNEAEKSLRINISMPERLVKKIDDFIAPLHITRSAFLQKVAIKEIGA